MKIPFSAVQCNAYLYIRNLHLASDSELQRIAPFFAVIIAVNKKNDPLKTPCKIFYIAAGITIVLLLSMIVRIELFKYVCY